LSDISSVVIPIVHIAVAIAFACASLNVWFAPVLQNTNTACPLVASLPLTFFILYVSSCPICNTTSPQGIPICAVQSSLFQFISHSTGAVVFVVSKVILSKGTSQDGISCNAHSTVVLEKYHQASSIQTRLAPFQVVVLAKSSLDVKYHSGSSPSSNTITQGLFSIL